MSDLNENGGVFYPTPTKIDPAAHTTAGDSEKRDTPKEEGSSATSSSGLAKSEHHFYQRDVYSSSPDEDDLDLDQEAEDKFIEIAISEPHKVGDGISSHMAYKVTTRTNLKPFRRESFSVTRRFSDFLGLHEKLSDKHAQRGRIIPPAPEKSLVGTAKVKMAPNSTSFDGGGGPNDELPNTAAASEREFIARRRIGLERFVNRVAQHPFLRRDSNFVEFLESVRDLPRATSTSTLSSASVFRLIGRMGDTVNKITYKMEETDPWFEDKVVQLEALETQLKKLYILTEAVASNRRDLAIATGSFAQITALLATTEEAHNLSRAMGHLAKVEEKVEFAHHKQADADFVHLFELIKDYVNLMGAVKDALTERQKAFQTWQHAQSMVLKKKEQRARLEMGGKLDKIPLANEEVHEWESRLEEGQTNFNRVSEVIKTEIDFFERYRVKDFKVAIIQYMEVLMECQLQLAQHWEEFLPEVKGILF